MNDAEAMAPWLGDDSGPAPGPADANDAPASLVAVDDWDDLLGAVKARLRKLVEQRPGGLAAVLDPADVAEAAARVQDGVLDCVSALDQLHLTLSYAIGRGRQLELAVFDGQAALAQARAELNGTRDGDRRVIHQALHDRLTALPNDRCFRERLSRTLALIEPGRSALAVFCIDLDDFKPINEAHGCKIGDEVLRIVAARLARTMRSEDMVSRLGSDRFGCLLAGELDRPQLALLADKVFDAVAAPMQVGTLKLRVRARIGIAVQPYDGVGPQALLDSADAARQQAKRRLSRHAFVDQQVAD